MKHEVELHEYSRRDTMPTEDDDVKKIIQKTKTRKISVQKSIDKLEEDEEESEGEKVQILKPQYPGGVPLSEDRLINFANQLDNSKTDESEIENLKMKTVEKISIVIDETYQKATLESEYLQKYEEPDSGIQIDSHIKVKVDEKTQPKLLEDKSEVKGTTEELPEDKDIQVKILKPMYPGGAELDDKERLKSFESQLQKTGKKIEEGIQQKSEKAIAEAGKAAILIKKTSPQSPSDSTKEQEPESKTADKCEDTEKDTSEEKQKDTPTKTPAGTPDNISKESPKDKPDNTPENIPKDTPQGTSEQKPLKTPKDSKKKSEIEDLKVKILKPRYPGGAFPSPDRLKEFDQQILLADSGDLENDTERLVAETISKQNIQSKRVSPEVDKSRPTEIIELEKLTIILETDDEVTIKLRKFLKFYLDIEIQSEFIFQRPAEFEATAEFDATKEFLRKIKGSKIQYPQVSFQIDKFQISSNMTTHHFEFPSAFGQFGNANKAHLDTITTGTNCSGNVHPYN